MTSSQREPRGERTPCGGGEEGRLLELLSAKGQRRRHQRLPVAGVTQTSTPGGKQEVGRSGLSLKFPKEGTCDSGLPW